MAALKNRLNVDSRGRRDAVGRTILIAESGQSARAYFLI